MADERIPAAPDWCLEAATTRRQRARGLLGRPGLADRSALWLPARSIHTIGMRFALDLVWLDAGGIVLRVDRQVGPGRLRSCWRARGGVLEVAAGHGDALAAAVDAATTTSPDRQRAGAAPHEGSDRASPGGRGGVHSSGSRSSARVRDPR